MCRALDTVNQEGSKSLEYAAMHKSWYCQAQPKVQTKASAFGWDGYNIIIIQPPTHPDKYEGDRIKQNLENKSCICMWQNLKTSWGWAGPSSATAGLSWSKVLIWLVDWLVLIQHCTLYHTSFYSSWLRLDGFWLFKSFFNFRWVEGRLNEMKAKHSPAKLCQVSIDLAILV